MLSLQWVTVAQKICPTDGLWVSWPAQIVVCSRELVSCGNGGTLDYAVVEWIPAAM